MAAARVAADKPHVSTTALRRVLYIHGLEAGPKGKKVDSLRREKDLTVEAEQMATPTFEQISSSEFQHDQLPSVMQNCTDQQANAISSFKPEVVVASSFGAAVCLKLMESRKWQGPTVLIAPAVELIRHGGKKPSLAGFPSPVFILHGKRDSLISPERSWELAATRDLHCNHIVLDILDDDHAKRGMCAKCWTCLRPRLR
eukprot:gnl/TRDRNA2_/TRDRNA2_165101_c0_seq9.p1 gnl/TRDRNA2_/TRDRNA2_165101_c0~~gnl/TRDRNA2_/TRDRNA2_165101_c0_seq9.p1  ORF type:complete len:218 (+),score=32.59 gnl/TRDRNA2_/TRDRNA2_165101_c0_seq9:55-654(+)